MSDIVHLDTMPRGTGVLRDAAAPSPPPCEPRLPFRLIADDAVPSRPDGQIEADCIVLGVTGAKP